MSIVNCQWKSFKVELTIVGAVKLRVCGCENQKLSSQRFDRRTYVTASSFTAVEEEKMMHCKHHDDDDDSC
jgi:hypothetical protein